MPADHRTPGAHIIDIRVSIDVENLRAFAAFDEQRRSAHASKCAHRRIDAAGNSRLRARKPGFGFGCLHRLARELSGITRSRKKFISTSCNVPFRFRSRRLLQGQIRLGAGEQVLHQGAEPRAAADEMHHPRRHRVKHEAAQKYSLGERCREFQIHRELAREQRSIRGRLFRQPVRVVDHHLARQIARPHRVIQTFARDRIHQARRIADREPTIARRAILFPCRRSRATAACGCKTSSLSTRCRAHPCIVPAARAALSQARLSRKSRPKDARSAGTPRCSLRASAEIECRCAPARPERNSPARSSYPSRSTPSRPRAMDSARPSRSRRNPPRRCRSGCAASSRDRAFQDRARASSRSTRPPFSARSSSIRFRSSRE